MPNFRSFYTQFTETHGSRPYHLRKTIKVKVRRTSTERVLANMRLSTSHFRSAHFLPSQSYITLWCAPAQPTPILLVLITLIFYQPLPP